MRKDINAEEVKVGDRVYFPNSRHAQSVTDIVEEELPGEGKVRWISVDGARWCLKMDQTIAIHTDQKEEESDDSADS